jgi:hypothetical protein
VALKRGGGKGGWVGEEVQGLLVFVALVCISAVVEGACVRDCKGAGECVGGRGGVVTG